MIHYFERMLRLTDVEVWAVRIEERDYTLLIVDERRAATKEDFPQALEEDLTRANLISATFFSEHAVEATHIERLVAFAHMLTDHVALAHCDVVIHFQTESGEQAVDRILQEKYGYTMKDIPLQKAMHFHQE